MADDAKVKASECPVCLDTYKDPRVLPACGHSVCFECAQKLIDAPPSRTVVACPECREPSRVPKAGFPKNFRLSDMLQGTQAGVTCNGCRRKGPPQEMFRCETCRKETAVETEATTKPPTPPAPRSTMTGYVLFSAENRKRVIAENPQADFASVSRLVGNEWRTLTAVQQQEYNTFVKNEPRKNGRAVSSRPFQTLQMLHRHVKERHLHAATRTAALLQGGPSGPEPSISTAAAADIANKRPAEQEIVLCAVCAMKHTKAYSGHDVVEYAMASKRDVADAVKALNALRVTYNSASICQEAQKVADLCRETNEAAENCEAKYKAIKDALVDEDGLTRDEVRVAQKHASGLVNRINDSQVMVLNALEACVKAISAEVANCRREVEEGGHQVPIVTNADAQPGSSRGVSTNFSSDGRKRKRPVSSSSGSSGDIEFSVESDCTD